MTRDPMLLVSIQVALLGVVMVAGFFYLWRSLSRMEKQLNELASRECNSINDTMCMPAPAASSGARVHSYAPEYIKNDMDDDSCYDEDEDAMDACFGAMPIQSLMDDAAAAFMMFRGIHENAEEKEGPLLEEIEEQHAPAPKHDGESSIAETEPGEFSKSKLKKMNMDTLRDLCSSRGLPTDGVKATLVDRILASIPKA
jgi:hypothetical protein